MPIYVEYKKKEKDMTEFEVLGIRHDINGKDFKYIRQLRNIIERTMVSPEFIYRSDGIFLSSISRAVGWTTNLANFDIARTRGRIDDDRYTAMMREFITQCNNELVKNNKLVFKDSFFDIFGGWTRGEIVLMVPKNKQGWKK